MAKQFVLRAGALLSRKKAYLAFGEAGDHLVIPMAIVEKLHYFEGAKRNMAAEVSEYIKSCPNDELLGKVMFRAMVLSFLLSMSRIFLLK